MAKETEGAHCGYQSVLDARLTAMAEELHCGSRVVLSKAH